MNIDEQVSNKFNSLKNYAQKHNLKWGFVRDKDQDLYLNCEQYSDEMGTSFWKPIEDYFETSQ